MRASPESTARPDARGHTIVEVLISGALLVIVLGLVVFPFLMLSSASISGSGKTGSQQAVRVPVNAMIRELQGSYSLQIYAPDPALGGSNAIAAFDTAGANHYCIRYGLDANRRLLRHVRDMVAGVDLPGSPFVVGRGLTLLQFLPRYENPVVPGQWLDFQLPLPNPASLTALPPDSNRPPGQGTLILVHAVGFEGKESNAVDIGTSFFLRN